MNQTVEQEGRRRIQMRFLISLGYTYMDRKLGKVEKFMIMILIFKFNLQIETGKHDLDVNNQLNSFMKQL